MFLNILEITNLVFCPSNAVSEHTTIILQKSQILQ